MGSIVSLAKACLIIALFCLIFCPGNTAQSKEFSLGVEAECQFQDAAIITSPSPLIPPELHEDCFKSCCIARFLIGDNGKTQVKLLTSSGSEEIDDITLSTLKRWKFRPAVLDGKPVPSSRRVKVEFQID